MLKRIAVVRDDMAQAEALIESAAARGMDAVEVSGDSPPPPGTAALIAGPGSGPHAIELAEACARGQEELLLFIAQAIDCRESFSPGSSLRVRDHAVRFAEALGWTKGDTFTFERAALLRDIGKLSIPNEVLLKSGVLTYDEWTALQSHAPLGAQMVEKTQALADTAPAIRSHHECFDGTGYPEGIEKGAIPLMARALKIVDVYCAMTSPRAYRKTTSSHESAIDYLASESGKHFDPELTGVFIDKGVGQPPESPEVPGPG